MSENVGTSWTATSKNAEQEQSSRIENAETTSGNIYEQIREVLKALKAPKSWSWYVGTEPELDEEEKNDNNQAEFSAKRRRNDLPTSTSVGNTPSSESSKPSKVACPIVSGKDRQKNDAKSSSIPQGDDIPSSTSVSNTPSSDNSHISRVVCPIIKQKVCNEITRDTLECKKGDASEGTNYRVPPKKRKNYLEEIGDSPSFSRPQDKDHTAYKEVVNTSTAVYPLRCEVNPGNYILGSNGTLVERKVIENINWALPKSRNVRIILRAVFGEDTLATHTLSGQPSPAFIGSGKPVKNKLDSKIVDDVLNFISTKYRIPQKDLRICVTQACADMGKKYRKISQGKVK